MDHDGIPERLAYTIPETARLLAVSVSTVKRMIASGTLGVIRVGEHRRVPRSELYRLIEQPSQASQEAQ